MLRFQIASDLHIDHRNNDYIDPLDLITPVADILILAGDIGSFYKMDQLEQFLRSVAILFKYVLYIPGNHEFYTLSRFKPENMDELLNKLYKTTDTIPNLYILNRERLVLGNICIAGCTLWSDLRIPLERIKIHNVRDCDYNYNFEMDLEFVKESIKYCKGNNLKLLMITHYPPTYKILQKIDYYSSLYASDLDHLLFKDKVVVWISGHTHKNYDTLTKGGTRLVSNQLGGIQSERRSEGYKKQCVIEVEIKV